MPRSSWIDLNSETQPNLHTTCLGVNPLDMPRGGEGCYLHVVPLVTSFRRLNTPSTCLPWVASRIGGRRDPGG